MTEQSVSDTIRKYNLDSTIEAKRLFEKNANPSMFALMILIFITPLKGFIFHYIKTYREGIKGLIASFLYAFYHYLIISKYATFAYKNKKI